MASDGEWSITTKCYVKMIMHALKYPHATVNGVILAKKTKDSELVDAVPLFHLGHGLTPMIEVALLQISTKCKERGLVIAGYYQANKYFHDSAPDVFAQKIADKIVEQNNQAVLVMINNFGLAASVQDENDAENALHLYASHDGKWKLKPSSLKLDDHKQAFDCLNELVYSKQRHFEIHDFDNHLDDISIDWSNNALNQLIDNTIKAL